MFATQKARGAQSYFSGTNLSKTTVQPRAQPPTKQGHVPNLGNSCKPYSGYTNPTIVLTVARDSQRCVLSWYSCFCVLKHNQEEPHPFLHPHMIDANVPQYTPSAFQQEVEGEVEDVVQQKVKVPREALRDRGSFVGSKRRSGREVSLKQKAGATCEMLAMHGVKLTWSLWLQVGFWKQLPTIDSCNEGFVLQIICFDAVVTSSDRWSAAVSGCGRSACNHHSNSKSVVGQKGSWPIASSLLFLCFSQVS